jgi:hypothetical protein
MLRHIWYLLFGPKQQELRLPGEGKVFVIDRQSISPRLAADAEVTGDALGPTDMENVPTKDLIELCEGYWNTLSEPLDRPLAEAYPEIADGYSQYVRAINELSMRGPELLPWALDTLNHSEYDAREQAAFFLGQLGKRNQLGHQRSAAIDGLCRLAMRSVIDDCKETEANSAAV